MRRVLPGKKTCLIALAFLVLLGALAYWQKDRLLGRDPVNQLAEANEANQEDCLKSVVAQGESCLPGLIEHLKTGNEVVCGNMGKGLESFLLAWGWDDPRTAALIQQLTEAYPQCKEVGKQTSLKAATRFLEAQAEEKKLTPDLARSMAALLSNASENPSTLTLTLAHAFLKRAPSDQGTGPCRDLVHKGLKSADTSIRLAAVQVLLLPPLKKDKELLPMLVPFLKEKEPPLRKAALLALASERDLLEDDDLLPLLHDADLEVQHFCELALRSRGLKDDHLLLARLISAPEPAVRLQVLDHLHRVPDLEPGAWLERLSQDPAPAVRAAAARAAANQSQVDLRGRLHQMAREDPSPTVRQLAVFYLTRSPHRYDED